jgi:hypothetical protein
MLDCCFGFLKVLRLSCVYEVWEWRSEIVDIWSKIVPKSKQQMRNIAQRGQARFQQSRRYNRYEAECFVFNKKLLVLQSVGIPTVFKY